MHFVILQLITHPYYMNQSKLSKNYCLYWGNLPTVIPEMSKSVVDLWVGFSELSAIPEIVQEYSSGTVPHPSSPTGSSPGCKKAITLFIYQILISYGWDDEKSVCEFTYCI